MNNCPLCVKEWPVNIEWPKDNLDGLKWTIEGGGLCESHSLYAAEQLKRMPKKVVLKKEVVVPAEIKKPFLPKVVAAPMDWHERPDNDGDMIE